MGGNNSYEKGWGGVPEAHRTHTDSGYKVLGHKVVYLTGNNAHLKNILNSNSENAIYLIASKEKDGAIVIHSVNVFKGHDLAYEINLKYDKDGSIIPYEENGSHAHLWEKNPQTGELRRTSHNKKNTFDIDKKYSKLISKIVEFNHKHKS